MEQTAPLNGKGESINITYTTDQEIEFKVSFLMEGEDGNIKYNPLHTIRFPEVPAGEAKQVMLDLTKSVAWSNKTRDYLLHVLGPVGANVVIHDIEFEDAGFFDVIGAALGHLFTDEAVQLSTGNYRWGYRALNIPVAAIWGIVLLVMISCWLLVSSAFAPFSAFRADLDGASADKSCWFHRSQRFDVVAALRVAVLVSLIFLLLYDARFSLDLLRTSARDISSWVGDGEYRQLGPLHKVINDLKREEEQFGNRMQVTLCTDLDDLYFKHLRYHMYPIKIDQGESWDVATHVVFVGKHHSVQPSGMIACREGQIPRSSDMISSYEEGSALYRFSP